MPMSGAAADMMPPPVERNPTRAHLAPEIVLTPPMDRALQALGAGVPDDAIAVLRPFVSAGNAAGSPLLADALVASGWKDVKAYRWNTAARKAREALTFAEPGGPSHGAHALLGESLFANRDFTAALTEFTKALAETPRDARLKRRVIRTRKQLRRPGDDRTGVPSAPGAPSAPAEPASEE